MIHLPAAGTVSASGGTGQVTRGPAQATRPSRITTTALRTGAPPVPSTSVAPMKAIGGGAAPRAGNAVGTATFQPAGVATNTRALTPLGLRLVSTTPWRATP